MPNFNNLFRPPEQIQFQGYDNGALAAALRNQQSSQQSQQQQQGGSNNVLSYARNARDLYNALTTTQAGANAAGMSLGGAGAALSSSPLWGGAGAAGYGGGVASTALPGIFPGATVSGSAGAGAGGVFGGGASSAGAGTAGAAAAATPAWAFAPLAIALYGMANGIWGPSDGPPRSARDNANTQVVSNMYGVTPDILAYMGYDPNAVTANVIGYGGSGGMTPLYNLADISGVYNSWLTPDVKKYMDSLPTSGGRSGMDMEHNYYENDNPLLAAYLYSQYGAPDSAKMQTGLGGYSDDQYGAAWQYFQGANVDLQKMLGAYGPGNNQS